VTIDGLSPEDLLKVFKGGGQGSLGVVTEIELESHKMSDFKAASIRTKGSLEETVDWLNRMDPETRRKFYFESHLNSDGSSRQRVRALAPSNEWEDVVNNLPPGSSLKTITTAGQFINSFLDKQGINSKQQRTRGANVMVPIDDQYINHSALQIAAGKGLDTSVYQAPSSEGTILTSSPGSLMVELEGNSQGDLNQMALNVLKQQPTKRFVNYVTTGIDSKPEEYFDKDSLRLIKRAMDHFNPKSEGKRISTSSLIDASDSKAKSCKGRIPASAVKQVEASSSTEGET